MRIVDLDQIQAAWDLDAAFAAVREGFIALTAAHVTLGAVGYLPFPAVRGDCHIKSAVMAGDDIFVVKIATGFPENPSRGLPSSNGMMAVFDSRTGEPICLLRDEGWLTDQRTAIAGAIAAELIKPAEAKAIGIVGTGIQARWQALLAAKRTGVRNFVIWGRRADAAESLANALKAEGLAARPEQNLSALAEKTDLVMTTTPSTEPLLTSDMFPGRARIVAVGADAPGKQEVESELTARMDILVTDSTDQCLDHGELHRAHAANLLAMDRIVELGALLSNPPRIPIDASVLVDLTGVGVQDLKVAQAVWLAVKYRAENEASRWF